MNIQFIRGHLASTTSAILISPAKQMAFVCQPVRHGKCFIWNKLLIRQVVKCLKKWNKLSFNAHQSPICLWERESSSSRLDFYNLQVFKSSYFTLAAGTTSTELALQFQKDLRGNSPPQVRWPLQKGKVFFYLIQCKSEPTCESKVWPVR
jgi:hypothetical protein